MNPIQWVIGLVQWFATGIQFALEHLHAAFATVAPLRAIGAFGLAIIVTTLAIRLLLFPLFGWQLNNARRLQEQQRRIQPQIQEVRRKYKKDPRKTAEELQRVYRENNMSPFSAAQGCLPALVQAPVLYALYYAIRQSTQHLHADLGFLWVSDVSKSA